MDLFYKKIKFVQYLAIVLLLVTAGCGGADGKEDMSQGLGTGSGGDSGGFEEGGGGLIEGGTDTGNPDADGIIEGAAPPPNCVSHVDCDGDGITKGCDLNDLDAGVIDLKEACRIAEDEDLEGGTGDGHRDVICEGDEIDPTLCDNCPTISNPDQVDSDVDGVGDACDSVDNTVCPDADGDTICDPVDNCPATFNQPQTDTDSDGIGDACDDDDDNDGILDADDNCPAVGNRSQRDVDSDGAGDRCDDHDDRPDSDGDGVKDIDDLCDGAADSTNVDTDGDALGDVCDEDSDNDGLANTIDMCPSHADEWELVNGTQRLYYYTRSARSGHVTYFEDLFVNGSYIDVDELFYTQEVDEDSIRNRILLLLNLAKGFRLFDLYKYSDGWDPDLIDVTKAVNADYEPASPIVTSADGMVINLNVYDITDCGSGLRLMPALTAPRYRELVYVKATHVCGIIQKDDDHDGIGDSCDNCPHNVNVNQIDGDRDGIGDACDDVFNHHSLSPKDSAEKPLDAGRTDGGKLTGPKSYPRPPR